MKKYKIVYHICSLYAISITVSSRLSIYMTFIRCTLYYPHIASIISSVQFSRSVMSDSLKPHELQHTRPSCPSETPGVCSHTCPLSQWCHPAISSSVVPFSSCPQSLPASGSFPTSQLFAWGGQNTGVSASVSVLPMNTYWSFNGPEPGGSECKREKEADIPWFTGKANRVLFLGLELLHGGTRHPLEWVKAQWAFVRGS